MDTSWLTTIIANPFAKGLAIGLFSAFSLQFVDI